MDITEKIREVANIFEIASQYTTLSKKGKNYVGLCPFHSEKTPSFTIDIEKQLYHCFGCGAGGDIFTLVMEKENLSFPEALRYLSEKYNIKLPERKNIKRESLKLEEKIFKIHENALSYFKKNLFITNEGKKALDYLKKRNISEDTIQELKIGYALHSWDSLLTLFQSKNISPELLEKAGLVLRRQNKEGHYDRFRGRIIFPIFNLTGKVIAFGGRTLYDEDPKYLNSPDTPIYNKGKTLYGLNFCKDSVREKEKIIIVEGYTDFLSLYQAGITNVAASLGTSLTSQQVSLSSRFAQSIVIGYDSDSAGLKAAARAVSICFEKGIQSRVLILPSGFDPDSFIKKFGADEFQNKIKNTISGLKFLIDTQLGEIKSDAPEEKVKIIRNIIYEIEKIPDAFVRSEYLKKASEYLSIDENLLRSMIKKEKIEENKEEEACFLIAEKRLLQMIFEDSTIAQNIFKESKDEDFKGLKSEPIFNILFEFIKSRTMPNFHELKEKIDPSLFSALSKILIEKGPKPSSQEAMDCLRSLKQYIYERRCKEINGKIALLERKGESEKLLLLLKERQRITEELAKQNYYN